MSRSVVFYDTEFTSWKGAWENNWSLPGQHRELVQIGALRYDIDNHRALDELCIFVLPVINPLLSDYFIDLTGITNEELSAKGVFFPDALKQLRAFVRDTPLASFGGDHDVMQENQKLNDMAEDFMCLDIRPWFREHGKAYGVTDQTNSGKLASVFGVEIDSIQEHNAVHDARSIAGSYSFLIKKDFPDFFKKPL